MATAEEIYGKDIAHKSDYIVTPTGDLDTIAGLENVKDALLRRLVTTPGSLIHRPNYGVGIKSYQNAPSSLAYQRELAGKIKEQFELDPRVDEVLGVAVDYDDLEPQKVLIKVRLNLVGYGETAMNFIPFGDV
jgi:phage baseplate assembly protein W